MIDKKWKGKIINSLRRLSYSYPPRNQAKTRQKVAPATFECEHCQTWVYEGSKTLDKLDLSPPKLLIKGKICHDHTEPIIPVSGFQNGDWDWNEYIENMFCSEGDFSIICKACHDKKTKEENKQRKEYRNRCKNVE
jgi:hypothetical protein